MTGRNWRDDRDEGFSLARARRRRAAIPLLTRALAGCRAERDAASGPARVEVVITESSILGVLLQCHGPDDDVEAQLGLLVQAVDVQAQLAESAHLTGVVRHGGHATMLTLSGIVEHRRAALGTEIERIDLLEVADGFFGRLVGLLLRLGLTDTALVAAERARARALRDVLAARGDDRAGPPPAEGALTAADLRDTVTRYGATVVEYWLDDDAAFAWVVRPGRAVVHVVLPAAAGSIRDRTDPRAQHELLITPLEGTLPGAGEPLAVVAHRNLHAVPFAALTGGDGRPLVERWSLVMLPSIGTLAAAGLDATRTDRPRSRLLAVADPAMPGALPQLPDLRAALPSFAALFAHGTVDLLTGTDATLRAVAAAVPDHDLVLLATHGHADDAEPARSFLALAPDGEHPGYARIDELAELRVDAGLVVLLACATAAGRVTGDGIMAIGRAFLLAGARSLVSTMWPVNERTATELGYWLVRHWVVDGVGPAEALRRAQLTMRARYPFEGPQLWAGFVLTGAWR